MSCFFSAFLLSTLSAAVAMVISFAAAAFSLAGFRSRNLKTNGNEIQSSSCYLAAEEIKNSKPQTLFKYVLADNSYNSFQHLNRANIGGGGGGFSYKTIWGFLFNCNDNHQVSNQQQHPYQEEIDCFLQNCEIQEFSFVNGGEIDLGMKGSHVWVDKKHQLQELAEVLSKQKVFAVDTEQHSFRSFLGFTALMQISTDSEDYLVDTIALHDVMGVLRPVFANPNICKVFHGADGDVIWLQRDFHIYVVNLFDTAKACDVLLKPHKSLEYLLDTYCGVATNKKLQLSDWRLRPLSEEMTQYARADTHYLLRIADCLAGELKHQNLGCPHDKFKAIRSCTKLYRKEFEGFPGGSAASSILSRYSNSKQDVILSFRTKEFIFRLCIWRDLMARVHDESLRYVLSDQAIVALAKEAPKVKTEAYSAIFKADDNMDSPSPIVSSHLEDICNLLAEKIFSLDDFFKESIQKYLGPGGSCPLSECNYPLTKSKLEVTTNIYAKLIGNKEHLVQELTCKKPVKLECNMYTSDGRLLTRCTRRKRTKYLNRNRARVVGDDSLDIILLFEPKGLPEKKEEETIRTEWNKNKCVSCGANKQCFQYPIIPRCYRQYIPRHMRRYHSNDVMRLCFNCHELAYSAAEKYKKVLAAEFKIPLLIESDNDSEHNEAKMSKSKFRSAADALLRHGSNIPTKRQEELNEIVVNFLGVRNISKEDLEEALLSMRRTTLATDMKSNTTPVAEKENVVATNEKLQSPRCNDRAATMSKHGAKGKGKSFSLGQRPHGKQVVNYLLQEKGEDGIHDFCNRWRRLFLDALNPRYLRSGWDVGL